MFEKLIRYFQYDKSCIYSSKVFGKITLINNIVREPNYVKQKDIDIISSDNNVLPDLCENSIDSVIKPTDENCYSISESIEEFFSKDYYNGNVITSPSNGIHLEKSPCKHLIGKGKDGFYYCKIHPEIIHINFSDIEHHINIKNLNFTKKS